MGTINHNAILATTWDDKRYRAMLKWVRKNVSEDQNFLVVSKNPRITLNGYKTIVLIPDGSKEGWDTSDEADELRQRFIERLTSDNYEDGSSSWDWIEVGYGEYGQKVLQGNCRNRFDNREYCD